jgi:pathogenesis-related protein 1
VNFLCAVKWMMRTGLIILLAGIACAQSPKLKIRPNAGLTEKLAREMLELHNIIRAEASLPPLKWSGLLAEYSQAWADKLLEKDLSMHNPNSPYGENIFINGGSSSPSLVISQWASEFLDYSHQTNSCKSDCGHYTQIVWRNTQKVGCAVARGARREIWVCSYDPPGNYRGEWPY